MRRKHSLKIFDTKINRPCILTLSSKFFQYFQKIIYIYIFHPGNDGKVRESILIQFRDSKISISRFHIEQSEAEKSRKQSAAAVRKWAAGKTFVYRVPEFRSNTGGMYRKPLYTVHRIAVLDADGTRLGPIKNVQSAETESKWIKMSGSKNRMEYRWGITKSTRISRVKFYVEEVD